MKSLLSVFTFSALLALASSVVAADNKSSPAAGAKNVALGKLIRVTDSDAAWAAKERKAYPLTVCVASDEDLGSMGDSPEYIYRVDGQPDRFVVFCCEGCEEDFLKEPAKYLARIDAAKAAQRGPGKGASGAHSEHH